MAIEDNENTGGISSIIFINPANHTTFASLNLSTFCSRAYWWSHYACNSNDFTFQSDVPFSVTLANKTDPASTPITFSTNNLTGTLYQPLFEAEVESYNPTLFNLGFGLLMDIANI